MNKVKNILLVSVLLVSLVSTSFAQSGGGSFEDLFQAPQRTQKSTNLGPFAVGYEFCQKIQTLGPILQAYSNVMWPVMGFPGFTMGIVQNESVIFKICDFLIKLETLETEGAIFASARFLNELTGKKWDNHLAQADLTWNIANSIYDFRADGGFRKGALASASTHRRLVSFADQTAQWYQSSFDGEENPEGIEDQAERRRKLNKTANLAYKRSILSEATKCPVPKGGKNLQKEYSQKVIPEDQRRDEAKRESKQIRRQMIKMGKDFLIDVEDLETYTKEIDQLIDGGYRYKKRDQTTSVDRKVPSGRVGQDGKPELEDVKEKVSYQKVSITRNTEMWTDFRNNYVEKWENWVSSQMLAAGTFGLLDGKRGRIEEKYKDYTFECSESKLQTRLRIRDRSDPAYNRELREEKNKCRENLKVRRSEFENLMDEYVRRLDTEVRKFKGATAKIWSFESFYLGTQPISEDVAGRGGSKAQENNIKSLQAPEEDCRPQFTPAEMQKLSMDLDTVNAEINQELMESSMQQQMMEEEKTKAEFEESQRNNKALLNAMEKGKESNFSQKKPQPIVAPNSSL